MRLRDKNEKISSPIKDKITKNKNKTKKSKKNKTKKKRKNKNNKNENETENENENENDRCCDVNSNDTNNDSNDEYLFDNTCLYCLLEVFLIGYDINTNTNNNIDDDIHYNKSLKYYLWEWIWLWHQKASSFNRILITPLNNFKLFEIRVDNIYGKPCGLQNELKNSNMTFEYYYGYSRLNVWGGWKFFMKGKLIKSEIYGNIDSNTGNNDSNMDSINDDNNVNVNGIYNIVMPPLMWKNIIWIRQLEMELMYKKYNGINRNLFNNNENKRINIYNENMNSIYDKNWFKNRFNNEYNITLNPNDISLIFGTKIEMICGSCKQIYILCKSFNICNNFKGYFKYFDLYQRHQALIMDL